jgi:hypothetical protein
MPSIACVGSVWVVSRCSDLQPFIGETMKKLILSARVLATLGVCALMLPVTEAQPSCGCTIDAGPNVTLNFPATKATLFGHISNESYSAVTVRWTKTNGPTGAQIVAPWDPITTVSFTQTGIYTFQISVTDSHGTSTATTTVRINAASNQTQYYVDPTYTGGWNDGSAAHPWTSLRASDSDYSSKWNTIMDALGSADVIVYFSARQARSDVSEVFTMTNGDELFVNRTCRGGTYNCPGTGDTTTKKLTLDGESLYNTNDTTPNWVTYTGTHKFKIDCGSSTTNCDGEALGWADDNKRDNVTIRGFEVTGSAARINFGGNDNVLEDVWSHDVKDLGAQVQFQGAVSDCTDGNPYPSLVCNAGCDQNFGKAKRLTVRNNLIERGIGEGLYIAGTYLYPTYGGCPSYGNTHSDILIEGNTINDPGYNGDEGDGMDLKAGLHEMVVRNNVVKNYHEACEGGGINANGIFQPTSGHTYTNYIFEQNIVHGGVMTTCNYGGGISLGATYGTIVRNNLIYKTVGDGGAGINVEGDSTFPNKYVTVYSNTTYGNASPGIGVSYTSHMRLLNNLLVGDTLANVVEIDGTTGGNADISNDYNIFANSALSCNDGSSFGFGTNDHCQTSTSGIFTSTRNDDYTLATRSPAIVNALNLSVLANLVGPYGPWQSTFTTDLAGTRRQASGTAWDIGAYKSAGGLLALWPLARERVAAAR